MSAFLRAAAPRIATPLFRPTFTRTMASAVTPYFADEPKAPIVKTEFPGPKNKAAVAELDKVFDTRSVNHLADYTKSVGN